MSRALQALGIRHILARSPEARGRSERTFETIQGRLPQELRVAGITDYAAANGYLVQHFVPDFNRRFTVTPAQAGRAFVPMVGIDLELLLSAQHERVVPNDSAVPFEARGLQLPPLPQRPHYVRCPVLVHEFPEGELGVSYQGRLLARYERDGQLLAAAAPRPVAERKAQQTGTTRAMSALPIVASRASLRVASRARGQRARPPGIIAPRAAGRPTPSAPPASAAGRSPTRAGAAAHNVDGDTRNPQQPATKPQPSYRAVHNVDSSLCHHPAPLHAREEPLIKSRKTRRKNQEPSGHLKLLLTRTCVSASNTRGRSSTCRWIALSTASR